jgi:hypothetical protein
VELFEQLRREYEFGIGTIKGVSRKFGVHRRLVRQAVNSALPPDRTYRQRSKPVLGAEFIDGILETDRHAPRKQRHTARRIYHRILAEMPAHRVAESTVRNYVHDRKRTLGLLVRETYVAQSYTWGSEAQWYEAYAELAGELTKLQVFCMRSMASGGAFHRAYLPASFSGRARTRLPALWRCLQAAAPGICARAHIPGYVPLIDMWPSPMIMLRRADSLPAERNIILPLHMSATFTRSTWNGGCHAGAVLYSPGYG